MAKNANNTVVVEVAGSNGESLYFAPMQRRLRGRFDYHTPKEPNARRMIDTIPEAVPGQRIELDLMTGETAVLEPLRHADNQVLAEKLRKLTKADFATAREPVGKLHLPTAIFWLNRAVEGGHAKVVAGELPADPGGKPRTSFLSQPAESSTDKLAAAIEKQTEAITALLRAFAKQQAQPAGK